MNDKNTTGKQKQNWYVKMHSNASKASPTKPKVSKSIKRLNLSIFFRIWVVVALIMVIAGIRVFTQLYEHVEPTSKQVIEDTLVDTGKLLAVYFAEPFSEGKLAQAAYQQKLDSAFSNVLVDTGEGLLSQEINNDRKYIRKEQLQLFSTWFYQKINSSFRVYVTDLQGMVIYDSRQEGNAEGQDYSKWNDVYLTLRGKYGARSSRDVEEDETTSIMYVAQPILDNQGKVIGVVSVGKPVVTIFPYLNVARQKMFSTSLFIMFFSVILAGIVAWWLQQSIMLVIRYTQSLAADTAKPSFYFGRELNVLTDNIEQMKHSIENKGYVTDYVHTLTHELKSPLTAIRASGELLGDADLDEEDRLTLSQTINEQSEKLQTLIDKLLLLAKVEQPNFRLTTSQINIALLLQGLLHDQQVTIQQRQLAVQFFYQNAAIDNSAVSDILAQSPVLADEFWLSQAINNLFSNAIYFADSRIEIHLDIQPVDAQAKPSKTSKLSKKTKLGKKNKPNKANLKKNQQAQLLVVRIINDGNHIPEFALEKLFDKYFSLSHSAQLIQNSQNSAQQNQANHEKANTQNSASRHGKKGTGLGLTLAKQVIEHHQGTISINNYAVVENVDDIDDVDDINELDDKPPANIASGVMVTITLPVVSCQL